jgi:hypothetical protein
MTFYAHYDKHTAAILAVGGHKLPDDFPDALVTEIDDDIALKFITFEWKMAEWSIGFIAGNDKPVVTQNLMDLVPHNKGDMIELPRGDMNVLGIRAAAILSEDQVEFSIPPRYRGKVLENLDTDVVLFTLTKRNDPTFVIGQFEVNIPELMAVGVVSFDCELSLRDYSMFTNRIFYHYQFETLALPKNVNKKIASARFNKTVVYRAGTTQAGIQATYDDTKHELELTVVGKTKLSWPNLDRCLILVTKPNDPSVVYHALPIDVETFWQDKRIKLQLPKDIDQAFGLASFPLSSDLVLTRKSDGNRNETNN